MKITHAIFDMDGTLTDSNGVWADAVYGYIDAQSTYKREDIPEIFYSEIILGGTMEALHYLKNTMNDSNSVETMLGIIMENVENGYQKKQQPKKGAVEFLKKLKEKGSDVCVISATPYHLVKKALELSGIIQYVDFILSAEDRKSGKESPYIFLEAAARMNCEIRECTLFEDALYSIRTGKNLGMTVVGIDDYYCRENTRNRIKEICDLYTDTFSTIILD